MTTNTDTGDTVNITTTEVKHSMDVEGNNKTALQEGQVTIQMGQEETAPREALVSCDIV